ncbi:hypothetical protein [Thiohalobacter thiocyanaticus]|nr:hypothetical protein [Thiohalobacter thiocyanaticus]
MLKAFVLVLLGLCALMSQAAETLLYRQHQSGEDSELTLSYRQEGEWVLIASQSDTQVYFSRCSDSGDTLQWQVSGEGVNLEARRQDETVVVSGTGRGGTIDYHFALDGLPWYQALSFALGQWLLRADESDDTLEFWMLRPDNYRPVRLQALRREPSMLTVGAGLRQARRVEVRPTGWRGSLWSASYWFETDTGRFLRYESGALVPGMAQTRIELSTMSP